MGCEESFITKKLIWHGYLVPSLGICFHKTPTETGLILPFRVSEAIHQTGTVVI